MDLLGEDSSDSDENKSSLKINTDYANRYDKWRKNEELQKLKDKYGDDAIDETSSTSEEEDEDAVELTEDVEKEFFKTLSCLKEKNPVIYDGNVKFFKEKIPIESGNSVSKPKKKEETLTMATYQRKLLLEAGGEAEPEAGSLSKFEDLPMAEQEKSLKESFKELLQDSDSDDGRLLLKKERSAEQEAKEEADYRLWLAGQDAAVDQEEASKLKGLRDYWTDPQLDDGEKFLRDYILKHRYLESDAGGRPENDLSSDSEEEVAEQEAFEHKYNFRFQEPDPDFIKRYPRTVEQSMRKKDDRRKQKREEVKARKEAERAKKDEELKRLKALKKAEILEKINKLKQVTGNEDLPFQEADVEGDFNPDEHDKRMSQLFSDEFYGATADDVKPQFHDLDEELEIENWDKWDGTTQQDLHCEDPGFVMDCDYDGNLETQKELLENTKKRRKRRQSKFAAAAAHPKPVFDPSSRSFEQYLDEYYALDYEDLIGDIPCRFKYRKTIPNDFGLSIEEILAAPDKELNKWASVKKIMRRRGDDQELYDVQAYRKKAQSLQKKMQCLPSLFAPPEEVEKEEASSVKRKRRKKKKIKISEDLVEKSLNESVDDAQRESHDNTVPRLKKNKNKLVVKKVVVPAEESSHKQNVRDTDADNNKVKKRKGAKSSQEGEEKVDEPMQKTLKTVAVETVVNLHATKLKKKKKQAEAGGKIDLTMQVKKKVKADRVIDTDRKAPQTSQRKKKINNINTETLPINEVIKGKKNKKFRGSSAGGFSPGKKQKVSAGGFGSSGEGDFISNVSDARLKSYGLNPKKFRNKLKYGNAK